MSKAVRQQLSIFLSVNGQQHPYDTDVEKLLCSLPISQKGVARYCLDTAYPVLLIRTLANPTTSGLTWHSGKTTLPTVA